MPQQRPAPFEEGWSSRTVSMTRRSFLRHGLGLSLSASVAASLLAACGPSQPPPAPAATAAPAPAATTAPAAAPTTAAPAPAATAAPTTAAKRFAGVALTASYMAAATYDKAATDLATDFDQRTGIKLSVAAFPWAVLRQNNTTDLLTAAGKQGGGQYDVMSGGYYLADAYQWFAPIGDLIQRDGYGKGMIPGLMDKGRAEYFQDQQIGVPYGADAYGLLYRTDLFKDAGLQPPKTWDDFGAVLKKLDATVRSKDIAPYVFAAGASEQLPALFFTRYGGTFVNKDDQYQLETDKASKALHQAKDLMQFGPSNMGSLSIDDANAVFLNGKAAILEGWPSFVRSAADDPTKSQVAGKWALMPYPDLGTGFVWLSMWNLFIPKHTKDRDAAWEWVKFYTSEENARTLFDKYGIGSTYVSVFENPEEKQKHGHDLPNALENLKRAKNPPLSGEAQDFMANSIGEVVTVAKSAEDTVQGINAKWASLPVPAALLEAADAVGLKAKA